MQLSVRDVDEEVFREFKAAAVRNRMTVGGALTLAMLKFRQELGRKGRFTNFTPFKGGKGTEHVSEDVDEILYGNPL